MRRCYLDTGPLLDFLLLRLAADPTGRPIDEVEVPGPMAKHLTTYLRTDLSLRRALQAFMARQGPFATVSGVVTEIYRHVRGPSTSGPSQAVQGRHGLDLLKFWRFAQDEFRALGLEEELVPLPEMELRRLRIFGPTDESLMSRASAEPDAVILTSDAPLLRWCRGNGIRAHWIQDLPELVGE